MSTAVSISAAPPIGSEIGLFAHAHGRVSHLALSLSAQREGSGRARFAQLGGSLGGRVHMRPSATSEKAGVDL